MVYLKLVLLFYSSIHNLGQTCLLEVHNYEYVLKSAEVEFDVVALQSFWACCRVVVNYDILRQDYGLKLASKYILLVLS